MAEYTTDLDRMKHFTPPGPHAHTPIAKAGRIRLPCLVVKLPSGQEVALLSSRILTASTLAITLLTTACVSPDSANVYQKGEMRRIGTVRSGVIEQIRQVKMEDSQGIGAISGGAIGGIAAGSRIGRGSGSSIAGIIGALLGGMLGDRIERGITRKDVLEIIVRLNSGERIMIVEDTDITLQAGQAVDVIDNGKTARVVPAAKPLKPNRS